MATSNAQSNQDSIEVKIAQALSDADTAKRRATMALRLTEEALKYSASTPRVGAMIRKIEKELKND
jgi:hypothetical protein